MGRAEGAGSRFRKSTLRVIVVDASVLVAILAGEPGADDLIAEIMTDRCVTTPLAVWETTISLARIFGAEPSDILDEVRRLLFLSGIDEVAVSGMMGTLAVDAYARFGKGRHPARLNFGDCFAYACAKHLGARLLFKGDDFGKTDISPV